VTPRAALVTLPYTGAYDWTSMIAWLADRAIPGVDAVEAGRYSRVLASDEGGGEVEVSHRPEVASLAVGLRGVAANRVEDVLTSVRRVFDVDRDLGVMRAALSHDPLMVDLLARHVGLRVPGGWSPFELAIRAVLGQQVTIGAARALAATLVQACGNRGFPSPHQVRGNDLSALRMPGARKATLHAVADATLRDRDLFREDRALDDTIARLRAVPGIGEWTAHYVALRALRASDAFPASDVGLLRGVTAAMGGRPRPRALLARAEAWRPHRAYAAQLLWAEDAARHARPAGASGRARPAASARPA